MLARLVAAARLSHKQIGLVETPGRILAVVAAADRTTTQITLVVMVVRAL